MSTSTRSVLIVGGSGFVGTHLSLRLRDSYKVFATYSSHGITIPGVTTLPLDVENRNWIKRVIQMTKPDVIIYVPGENTRGKRVDFVDLENLHSKGAANILNCAEMLQPRFIYLSTSYVFDGDRGNYREGEAALPLTPLGRAKMSAENFIRSKSLHSIIIRSSPLFGRGNGLNLPFLDRLRMQLDRGKPIEVPANELHSFAPVEGLAEMISELILKSSMVRAKALHFGGLTKVTHADFARGFARRFGYDPKLIIPIMPSRNERHSSGSHRGDKKEILDFSLNSSQAVELLKIKPLLLEEGFDLIEKKLVGSA